MRNIKFRAWDNGHMYPMAMAGEPANPSVWTKANWRECTEKVILMQFTGLKDKNRKEIYEGDVLIETINTEYGDDQIKHEVEFNAGAFYPICMQPSETFEIIGNIYENPDLIWREKYP